MHLCALLLQDFVTGVAEGDTLLAADDEYYWWVAEQVSETGSGSVFVEGKFYNPGNVYCGYWNATSESR